MSEAERERIKLTANFLNNASIALFAVALLAPVLAMASGAQEADLRLVLAVLAMLAASIVLHLWGYRHLGRLR